MRRFFARLASLWAYLLVALGTTIFPYLWQRLVDAGVDWGWERFRGPKMLDGLWNWMAANPVDSMVVGAVAWLALAAGLSERHVRRSVQLPKPDPPTSSHRNLLESQRQIFKAKLSTYDAQSQVICFECYAEVPDGQTFGHTLRTLFLDTTWHVGGGIGYTNNALYRSGIWVYGGRPEDRLAVVSAFEATGMAVHVGNEDHPAVFVCIGFTDQNRPLVDVQEQRRALIIGWRMMVAKAHQQAAQTNVNIPVVRILEQLPEFHTLRPYLSQDTLTTLNSSSWGLARTIALSGGHPHLTKVSNDIDRIEKEWGVRL